MNCGAFRITMKIFKSVITTIYVFNKSYRLNTKFYQLMQKARVQFPPRQAQQSENNQV